MGLLDDYQNSNKNDEEKNINSDNYVNINSSQYNSNTSTPSFKIILLIIAIISGNIGSGYTTFWGINKLIDSLGIAILMTITIQGVMTATALIATNKKVLYKKSFVSLYVIPMIVSIGFNYVYFYSKFYNTSINNSLHHNNIVQLEKEKNKLQNYLSSLSGKVKNKYQIKKEKLLLEIAKYEKIKKQELTKYGTGGKGEGPNYMEAEKNERYNRTLLSNLEKKKKEISVKEKKIYNDLTENNNKKELKKTRSELLQYRSNLIDILDTNILQVPKIFVTTHLPN